MKTKIKIIRKNMGVLTTRLIPNKIISLSGRAKVFVDNDKPLRVGDYIDDKTVDQLCEVTNYEVTVVIE